ncbi:MAG: mRNA 3'-end processing factor [Lautropia sp. SCN 69-89]|nr:MAG: mRNA 3'-end processing factor [Lautropia sp. SCN 69-89]
MKLTFAGAADTVTGSRYLLDSGGRQILLDCGLFQGFKKLRDRNWAAFALPPREIDRVVLSHAHLDHSGYLPALVRDGFRGQIVATEATRELCEILLRDSARLQEEEADFANRHGYSKHSPARPLYTTEDAERALGRFLANGFDRDFDLGDGIVGCFLPAGHLLGASIVRLQRGHRTLVYSGDLGRPNDLVMRPPRKVDAADTLIVESTYGDREHGGEDPEAVLGRVIRETASRGGTILIPSFAVGRAQTLLYALHRLKQRDEIPEIPVFLDSPMAVDATRLYRRFEHDHRLTPEQCAGMYRAAKLITTPAESKRLATLHGPLVIISASGMATGGRVLHHLKRVLPDPANHVVFAGFQAPGTRGAHLVAGVREVRIHGEWHPVRAGVTQLDGFSAHADSSELIDWMRGFHSAPKQVYVTHGEPEAADRLRVRIEKELGWRARVPEHMETVELPL